MELDLLPFDVGTETGSGFSTDNPAEDPAVAISTFGEAESSRLFNGASLGRLVIERAVPVHWQAPLRPSQRL